MIVHLLGFRWISDRGGAGWTWGPPPSALRESPIVSRNWGDLSLGQHSRHAIGSPAGLRCR
jgi:hypothetical protein